MLPHAINQNQGLSGGILEAKQNSVRSGYSGRCQTYSVGGLDAGRRTRIGFAINEYYFDLLDRDI
jgi:hypothetical protein